MDAETLSPRTAVANRTTIRRALFAIEEIAKKDGPMISEIEEINTLCQIIMLSARKWKTAENLIIAAETARRRGK